MLFLQYLLMVIGALVVLRITAGVASRVADSFRFRGLLGWLEMDSFEVAKRLRARDFAGLVSDVHAKLNERQTLLMFRIERAAIAARDAGQLPAEEAEVFLNAVRETRDLQSTLSDEFDFAGVYVGLNAGASEETQKILGPVVRESMELQRRTAFFYRFLNRNSMLFSRPKNGTQ